MSLLTASCDGSTGPDNAGRAASVLLFPATTNLLPGDSATLRVSVTNASGDAIGADGVAWSSSDEAVAVVHPGGLVEARSAGTAAITAEQNGQRATARVHVLAAGPFTSITTGVSHVCALARGGKVYCWGNNYHGQLGGPSLTDCGTPPVIVRPCSPRPAPVAGPYRFESVSAGGNSTCGLAEDGTAYCWGANDWGQLGIGGRLPDRCGDRATPCSRSPQQVMGGHTFVAIAIGGAHTCALTAEGQAYCWGYGVLGRLGNGDDADRSVPTPVAGDTRFAAIAAGGTSTCGLSLEGRAYCWGTNRLGQVGDGTAERRLVPTPVATGLVFGSIRLGGAFGCATVAASREAYCWGANLSGKLGTGPPAATCGSYPCTPAPAPVMGGLAFDDLALRRSICGATGEAGFCWGQNEAGRLGIGTDASTTVPTPVVGGGAYVDMATASSHTCGITLADGAFCWGQNYQGVLGTGSTDYTERSAVPVPVAGPA